MQPLWAESSRREENGRSDRSVRAAGATPPHDPGAPSRADGPAPRHRADRPSGDRGRLAVLVVLGVALVLHVVWRLWLVRDVTALTVRVDEDNYLLAARVLSGGPGGESSENALFRRIGYPLLISPAYWFSQDPLTTYRTALGIGAVLNSLTLVPAYLVARRVLGLTPWLSVAAATAVTALPAVAFYSQVAMTDTVLPMLFLWWVVAVHAALRADTPRAQVVRAALTGVAAAGVWFVHVRGLVVLLVELVVVGLLLRRHRRPRVAAAALAGIGAVLAVELAIRLAIRGEITSLGSSPTGTLTERLTSPAGWVHIGAWALGQLWYMSVATLGLAAVGLCVALVWWTSAWRAPAGPARTGWRSRDPATRDRAVTVALALATTLGVAALSAATLPDDERINLYAYGRYVAFLAPLWVLVAIAGLATAGSGTPPAGPTSPTWRRPAALAGAATVLIAGTAAVVVLYSRRLTADAYIAFDSPEIGALTGVWDGLPVVRASLVGIAVLVGLVALFRTRARSLAVAAVAAFGLVTAPTMAAHATHPMAAEFAPAATLARAGVGPGDQVAESIKVVWWARANHQWEVWWDRIDTLYGEQDPPPAGATVVVAPYDSPTGVPTWDGTRWGWRTVYVDPGGWAVWRP